MALRQLARAPLLARSSLAPRARVVSSPLLAAASRQVALSPARAPIGAFRGYASAADHEQPRRGRFGRFVRNTVRLTVVVFIGATAAFFYVTQTETHPPDQEPQDPHKPTMVVLGSGWGATSFLKNLDTDEFNVIVISPRNYFLFTPLLPSVTVGTLEARSLIQPTRFITRHKKRAVQVYEAEAQDVDPINKTITFQDVSDIQGSSGPVTIHYDYLVYAVGCENQTFGMKGVTEHACFLKELWDADKIRQRLMDCIETAAFKNQPEEEIDRLMHMVVVGGGPTGVEYAGELHDFLHDDLQKWYPEIAGRLRITLIEALPNVLPAFSKQLIQYTESTFKENKIEILTRTMVKDVKADAVVVQDANKEIREIPYGLLVWATGNTSRPLTRNMMSKLPHTQNVRRGLVVDDHLRMLGAEGIYALGDCTATQYAPTAQVASQQGKYLAKEFNRRGNKFRYTREVAELRAKGDAPAGEIDSVLKKLNRAARPTPFHYSHQGSLAYIGSEKAIADLPLFNGNVASGGGAAMLFWRSAYVSTLYSIRNRALVLTDWLKVKLFGRDVSRS